MGSAFVKTTIADDAKDDVCDEEGTRANDEDFLDDDAGLDEDCRAAEEDRAIDDA